MDVVSHIVGYGGRGDRRELETNVSGSSLGHGSHLFCHGRFIFFLDLISAKRREG